MQMLRSDADLDFSAKSSSENAILLNSDTSYPALDHRGALRTR